MYFLLNMVIFQPAMLAYQRVDVLFFRPLRRWFGSFSACKFSPKTSSGCCNPRPLRKVKQQQRSRAPGEKKSRTFEHRIVRMPGGTTRWRKVIQVVKGHPIVLYLGTLKLWIKKGALFGGVIFLVGNSWYFVKKKCRDEFLKPPFLFWSHFGFSLWNFIGNTTGTWRYLIGEFPDLMWARYMCRYLDISKSNSDISDGNITSILYTWFFYVQYLHRCLNGSFCIVT